LLFWFQSFSYPRFDYATAENDEPDEEDELLQATDPAVSTEGVNNFGVLLQAIEPAVSICFLFNKLEFEFNETNENIFISPFNYIIVSYIYIKTI